MPLHVNELGIEFSVGKDPAQNSNDNACCDDDLAAQKAAEDRLVARAAERVLLALRAQGER